MTRFLSLILMVLIPLRATGWQAPSSAERKISEINQALTANPESLQSYNDLAAALCERARETGGASNFTAAQVALQRSFQIAPGDYSAQKLQVEVLLGMHRWQEAAELVKSLNRRVPDDVAVWGLVAETELALGNYPQAQKAAQWMFDLRPGNAAAYSTAAKVREVYGDLDGASEFVSDALRRVPENETEIRAILMTESARLLLLGENPKRASALLDDARRLFPAYHQILKVAAMIEKESGRFQQAADLLGRRYQQLKSSTALYDYAEALELAGRKPEATVAFRNFEIKALSESTQADNANRELIFYYADHTAEPSKALRIASSERAIRHDIATLDALAWALFRNGKIQEAKAEIQHALETGTRDREVLNHAKRITAKE